MPDLNFQVKHIAAVSQGLTPLFHFTLQITTSAPMDSVEGLLLNVQIQIQAPQRAYNPREKEKLVELFGPPELWGQSLRNRLWTHANTTVGAFTGSTETVLSVPCSFDLNIATTKYLYALEDGEVPLLFLFSGSLFYAIAGAGLQIERIPWSKECVFKMPLASWKALMDAHYPNCAWLYLEREVFDRLHALKRRRGAATWDELISHLVDLETAAAKRCPEGHQRPRAEVTI